MRSLIRWATTKAMLLKGSLWFIPTLLVLGAFALAFVTVVVDRRFEGSRAQATWFLFGVGAEGARGVLSAIAGSIITVTGVVFSITIVALQLASTQYSPRVLRTFLEDRANQVVLGVFIATFTYSLLILRTVRGESDDLDAFVPSISVSTALLLGIVSVGLLIFFINHIAQSIRASVIIERLRNEAVVTARRAFPRELGAPAPAGEIPLADVPGEGDMHHVAAAGSGYLQLVDEDALLELQGRGPIVVRMQVRLGEFVRTGDSLATVRAPAGTEPERLLRDVRDAFTIGREATGPQDVALGITRLTDVAIRALSPGINDPGTAMSCLDALSEVLLAIGERADPAPVRHTAKGEVYVVTNYPGFDELVTLAFRDVRRHADGNPTVLCKLLEAMEAVGKRLNGDRKVSFVREIVRTWDHVRERVTHEDARRAVHDRANRALRELGADVLPSA